jgi:urease accessory protein
MSPTHDWQLWQLIDSAFPAGGFVHSGGLEAAVQLGEVNSSERVEAFIEASLQQCAHAAAPFTAAVVREPARFAELDRLFDVTLTNTISNKASRSQGASILATAAQVWPSPALTAAVARVRSGEVAGHLPTCFGMIAAALALSPDKAVEVLLFQHLRGLASASIRLGIIGPIEAQRLQRDLGTRCASLIATGASTPPEEATSVSPLLDLIQAQHGRLYSRLFVS